MERLWASSFHWQNETQGLDSGMWATEYKKSRYEMQTETVSSEITFLGYVQGPSVGIRTTKNAGKTKG